ARAGAERPAPGAHHSGVPRGKAAARPCAGRLQSERVGADARIHLLGTAAARSDRLDARDVERSGTRARHRGLHDEKRSGARREARRPLEAAALEDGACGVETIPERLTAITRPTVRGPR